MKKRIAVLFGGCSSEYEVSLASAEAVLRHMDRERYEPVAIGITRRGDWYHYTGRVDKLASDAWYGGAECVPLHAKLSRSSFALLRRTERGEEPLPIDAAFPILHGKNGEDGTVQGLFELMGVPVVGCGVLASSLCMDKDRAHRIAAYAGVAVPRAYTLGRTADRAEVLALAEAIGYPLIVKPVRAGSSFGISKVTRAEGLPQAVELALRYDDRAIVEEFIAGIELGCAVLGNEAPIVGGPDEIELSGGFFDYTEKYTLKTSAIHVPARVAPDAAERVREAAKTVYRALGCKGFARVDFFLTDAGELVFNEANTIPGFTAHSRYPKMMEAAGLSFTRLITMAIEEAFEQ